jgi:putative nucleotidyltransferase with HDIG domain
MSGNIRSVLRIVLVYIFLSIVWIYTSDSLASLLEDRYGVSKVIQTYKGTAFVLITGGLLFIFLLRELRKREADWNKHLEEKENLLQEKEQLLEQLHLKNVEILDAYEKTIKGWSLVLEKRNREVKDHSRRVTYLTEELARFMGLDESEIVHIRRGSLLHDIGKMAIPDRIMLKNGDLTDEERAEIRRHPLYGFEMLSESEFLRPAMDILLCHHERWNGDGYPFGLAGEQIPLYARIFSVVDVWDALLADDRPYRSAETPETAAEYLRGEAGSHFDPHIVDAFLKMIEQKPELIERTYQLEKSQADQDG